MKFTAGASCDFTHGGWRDPSVPYKIDDKGAKVMRPSEGKEVWRDTAPLSLLNERSCAKGDAKVRYSRPHVIEQWTQMVSDGYFEDGPLRLALYGMRTDLKMKVYEWHAEPLTLPRELVLQDDYGERVLGEMARADSVAYALKRAIQKTYKREGKGNAKAFEDLIAYAQRRFWHDTHDAWGMLLRQMAELSPRDGAGWPVLQRAWWAALRKQGEASLTAAIGGLDTDAEALRRQVDAEQSFQNALYMILATEAEKTAREAAKKSKKAGKRKSTGKSTRSACTMTPAAEMTEERKASPAHAFVGIVRGWNETQKGRLAVLRRNAGEPLREARGVTWIYDLMNDFERIYGDETLFLTATLIALDRPFSEKRAFVHRLAGPHDGGDEGRAGRKCREPGAALRDSLGRRLRSWAGRGRAAVPPAPNREDDRVKRHRH